MTSPDTSPDASPDTSPVLDPQAPLAADLIAACGQVGERRLAVRVSAAALTQVRRGSPWVYEGSITSVTLTGDERPGDLAVIFDEDRRFVAIGLWDPQGAIRIRVLHQGAPRPIDGAFFAQRIEAARTRRAGLHDDPDTDAYRVIHGENDALPALVVDRYDTTLVVKVYSAIWWPHLPEVLKALIAAESPTRIVLRLARTVRSPHPLLSDGAVLWGAPVTGPVLIRERGLRLEADVVAGHKTGHFLDQRDNRALVRAAVGSVPQGPTGAGAEVLDVFAHTGGFALSAAAGGARFVHLVDASAPALATAERNFAHNRHIRAVRECAVRTTVGDAFDVLADLHREGHLFDMVIIDPPSFASSERSVPAAVRAYGRLTRAGLQVLRRGGMLVQASCSSRIDEEMLRGIVHEAAAGARRDLVEVRRTGHPIDHPVGFDYGAYLTAVYATVRD